VEIGVVDTIGNAASVTKIVPTDQVDFNLREGGKGAGFGEYAEEENVFSVAGSWTAKFKGPTYFYTDMYHVTEGGEIEWFFPPMLEGVEYRTAERFNGLPVYTKFVQLSVTASGESTVQWNGSSVSPIRHAARFYAQTLPLFDAAGNHTFAVRLSANSAIFYCALDWVINSNNPVWLQVWYHK